MDSKNYFQLFALCFPSWKLFGSGTGQVQLLVRKCDEQNWWRLLVPDQRSFKNLFLSARANDVLFQQSLIERFVGEIEGWNELDFASPETKASYRTVHGLVRWEIARRALIKTGEPFEFLIQVVEGGQADVLVRSGMLTL